MNAPTDSVEARELALAGMGQSRLRKEDARFIQGKGNYVDDMKLPGMLHMDIVRAPVAHARIIKINKEAALAMPATRQTTPEPFWSAPGLHLVGRDLTGWISRAADTSVCQGHFSGRGQNSSDKPSNA